MSAPIKIRRGLDIRLAGEAEKKIFPVSAETFASKPTDFIGLSPKLLVHEGDEVKAGSPLYHDKHRDQVIFTSPVSGRVKEIRRGEKRILQEVIIEAGKAMEYVDFGKANPHELTRGQVVEKMMQSGVWPVLRQRPYSIIANQDDNPKAIVISAFDTSPLAPDYNFILEGEAESFRVGCDALRMITTGKIFLNIQDNPSTPDFYRRCEHVLLHRFTGPHPAGNVSTQIHRLSPINKGEVIWYLRPQDVLTIGRLFRTGFYDATKVIALTGSMTRKPAYYKTLFGACIREMVNENLHEGKPRCISGNVLTGTRIAADGYVGFYDSQVTVIPEGDYHEFLGWAMPGWKKFSFYTMFFSWLRPGKKYSLDTNMHGGRRAFVMTGKYERVFPFNIYPLQLIKAILVKDIDLMENLGIYEVDAEDFALIEFIDTSKTEIQTIVREGMELLRKEMT